MPSRHVQLLGRARPFACWAHRRRAPDGRRSPGRARPPEGADIARKRASFTEPGGTRFTESLKRTPPKHVQLLHRKVDKLPPLSGRLTHSIKETVSALGASQRSSRGAAGKMGQRRNLLGLGPNCWACCNKALFMLHCSTRGRHNLIQAKH